MSIFGPQSEDSLAAPFWSAAREDRMVLLIAYLFVPGSPIDVQYHVAREIITSAYYRPIFMGSVGILLVFIYVTLYRGLYRRIHANLRTENFDLTWKNLRIPALLAAVSVVLGVLIIT